MSEKVIIYSAEHGAWWGPNGGGYWPNPLNAGLYSREEAERRTSGCGPEKGIEIQSAPADHPELLRERIAELEADLAAVKDELEDRLSEWERDCSRELRSLATQCGYKPETPDGDTADLIAEYIQLHIQNLKNEAIFRGGDARHYESALQEERLAHQKTRTELDAAKVAVAMYAGGFDKALAADLGTARTALIAALAEGLEVCVKAILTYNPDSGMDVTPNQLNAWRALADQAKAGKRQGGEVQGVPHPAPDAKGVAHNA